MLSHWRAARWTVEESLLISKEKVLARNARRRNNQTKTDETTKGDVGKYGKQPWNHGTVMGKPLHNDVNEKVYKKRKDKHRLGGSWGLGKERMQCGASNISTITLYPIERLARTLCISRFLYPNKKKLGTLYRGNGEESFGEYTF